MATPTNLPASFTAGNVLTAAQLNSVRGAFRILQVVQGTTTTITTNSTTTYIDTNLSATITPQDSASRILIYVNHAACYKASGNPFTGLNARLLRGGTTIVTWGGGLGYTNSSSELTFNANWIYLDSPATTSAVTYKTQFAQNVAVASVQVQTSSVPSTMLLMEVSS